MPQDILPRALRGHTMKLARRIWLPMLFSLAAPLMAFGQECPPVPSLSGNDINTDTKASLGAIPKWIAKLTIGVDIKNDIRNVFIEHPETMQYYVVLVMYHDGCVVIRDDAKLSTTQREERLDTLRKSVASEFQLTPVATTSPPLSGDPSVHPPTSLPHPRQGSSNTFQPYDTAFVTLIRDENETANTRSLTWAERYLRPVPVVITKGNQYWVNVGYAKNEAEGSEKLAELKTHYPNYDFALYSPFGHNNIWNITMASWVSNAEAQSVLQIAKTINPTSFAWRACRTMNGDECILDYKLREALKLQRK
jgi:hypothetical protein